MKLAIIIGVSNYEHSSSLEACSNDSEIMYNIFRRLDKFEEILFLNDSPKAADAKQKITSFIKKYKDKEITEFVFYFTGHGHRFEGDFFYTFSDFSARRIEATGLRNTELDGLIRNLSPELTVKIVDACYSGTLYIKSENDDFVNSFEKSAKRNELNKVYFLSSSSSDEESFASNEQSFFTLSFCQSIVQNTGPIRYRDVMAYIADDMRENGYPKPSFVIQADNTEEFGIISEQILEYVKGIVSDFNEKEDKNENDKNEPEQNEEFSLLAKIKSKSETEYCNFEEASSNLREIAKILEGYSWHLHLKEMFEINLIEIGSEIHIPNVSDIGRWIHKNSDKGLFATVTYKDETYYINEYVEVPEDPNSNKAIMNRMLGLTGFLEHDKEYKLERIEKVQKVVDGFEFSAESPFIGLNLCFKPKEQFLALENYSLFIVLVFSRNELVVFSSMEVLKYNDWELVSTPQCSKWKIKPMMLKNLDVIRDYFETLASSMSDFILDDVSKKFD